MNWSIFEAPKLETAVNLLLKGNLTIMQALHGGSESCCRIRIRSKSQNKAKGKDDVKVKDKKQGIS